MKSKDPQVASAAAFRALPLFGRAGALFKRDFAVYAALALVAALPAIAVRLGTGLYGDVDDLAPKEIGMEFAMSLAESGVGGVLDGACCAALFAAVRGDRATFAEAARAALVRAAPLALSNLGVLCLFFAGFLLFVAPGFMALTRYFLVLPVCMAEDLGPKGIFARSVRLTEGARWRIFALALFSLMLPMLLEASLAWIPDERAVLVVRALMLNLAIAYSALVGALAYLELRRLKEGTDNAILASVFA